MKRTIFPQEGTYEIDGVFLKKEEAFERLRNYIGEEQYKRLCNIEDMDESESVFNSLYSLYDRTLQNKNSSRRLEDRIEACFQRGYEKAKKMKKERVNFVVAVDNLFAIGKDNMIPWHQSTDLKHFKELTTDGILVMGYNTYLSVGNLPNREIRVLTRKHYKEKPNNPNVKFYYSPISILEKNRADYRELFVVGGQQIYETLFPKLTDLYITFVDTNSDGDTYFPEIPFQYFETREVKAFNSDNKNEYNMKICHLRKKGKKELPVKQVKYRNQQSWQNKKYKYYIRSVNNVEYELK